MRNMKELSKTLHPMTIGDILDRSIQLYRSNILKFIGIVLFVKGPYLLFAAIIKRFFVEPLYMSGAAPAQMATYEASAWAIITITTIIMLLELLIVGPILIAAMTMAISERFLNRDVGVTEAYRKILRRFLPLLGTIILTGMLISAVILSCGFLGMSMLTTGTQAGMLMAMVGLVLAGVLWIWYTFIPQTVVLEGEGGISAMKRSKYLVKGHFFKAFVLLILVYIAIVLIIQIASFGVAKGFFFLGQYAVPLAEGTSNVVSVLLEPFRIAAITLLYYDFRIRKEGFDLEIMAEELESGIKDDFDEG
jgi:hypothetical protein